MKKVLICVMIIVLLAIVATTQVFATDMSRIVDCEKIVRFMYRAAHDIIIMVTNFVKLLCGDLSFLRVVD